MKDSKGLLEELEEKTNIDVDAIAKGFYDIIPDSEKECMRLGMLPKKFMDLLHSSLVDKFERNIDNVRIFWIKTFEGMPDYEKQALDDCKDYVKRNVEKVERAVQVKLIKIACDRGLCVV